MRNPLFETLFAPLKRRDDPFFIIPHGAAISGGDFYRMIARFAGVFAAHDIQVGDRIVVKVEKSVEALACYGAAVAIGAVFVPLNPAYTGPEVDYFLADTGARLFVCDGADEAEYGTLCLRYCIHMLTLNANGTGSLPMAARAQSGDLVPAARGPDDLAALLYTSGTTGRSKGAMITQRNLLSNAHVLADLWQFSRQDVLLHALPVFHTHGLFVALNIMLLCGGKIIFLPKFDLEEVLAALPAANVMMGVPTFYTRLLQEGRFGCDNVAHMRLFISGSAPLTAQTHDAFYRRTGHMILERYGMTETNMNSSNPYDGPRKAGTVGLPLPGVGLRIMGAGGLVPQGEVGGIEVRGPNVFKGYWNMPEKTKEELRADGWFITGDLGYVDEDGYLVIVGRSKDLVISGGFNIYPKEIELLLDQVAGVLESAVIGVPHGDLGEAVLAVVVPKAGHNLVASDIMAAIEPKIARFKQPRGVVIVPALPRNAMGKVQKNLLRGQYQGWFSS